MTTQRIAYSPKEFAEMTGVSLRTVYQHLYEGTIASKRIGDRWLIPVAVVEQFAGKEESTKQSDDE